MADTILQTKELTKKYSGINVVNNVNIEISRGDIYGFIGANGAGKSTFMRMIAGLVKPTGGSVSLLGVHEATRLPHARKKLGVLIEQPALYNHLTATENLEVQRRYLGIRERKRINDVLEIVGLTGTGKKRAGKFSSGTG